MKQFFLTMLGVFAGLVLFFVLVPVVLITIAISSASSKEPTPSNTVLELDLREGVTDQAPTNPFAMFGGGGLSTMQIVDTLAQAEDDGRVKALLIRLPEAGITPAAADEIRQAVRRFRRSGKPVLAHAQGFQPIGTAVSSYMIGASASELWMQNTSSFQLAGFSADSMFLGRAFEKYGVNAQFEQRYEYKNAVNEFTESDFTPAHREAMTAWMTSIYTSALANAAHGLTDFVGGGRGDPGFGQTDQQRLDPAVVLGLGQGVDDLQGRQAAAAEHGERIGRRLVGHALPQVQLQHGVRRGRRLRRGGTHRNGDQHDRHDDEEQHQAGENAEHRQEELLHGEVRSGDAGRALATPDHRATGFAVK